MRPTKTRSMAVAMLTAGLMAVATGCLAKAEKAPELSSMDSEMLVQQLSESGLELESYTGFNGTTFAVLHGFTDSNHYSVTGIEEDRLLTYDFIGPAEAVMAATRVREDGVSYMFPINDTGTWRGIGPPYGLATEVHVFVEGHTVAVHEGSHPALADALRDVMGEPVAGSEFPDSPYDGDKRKELHHFWVEEPVPVDGVVENFQRVTDDPGAVSGAVYVVLNGVQQPHSLSCVGQAIHELEVVDNEVRITLIARVADMALLDFVDGCEINREPQDRKFIARNITYGNTYEIIVNGETVGTLSAVREGDS